MKSSTASTLVLSGDVKNPIQLQRFSKELNFKVLPDIPELLYLRRMTVNVRTPRGKRAKLVFYVFYNYRGTVSGTVFSPERHLAKRALVKQYPMIQFYR